jgi:hypothetical protein
VFRHIAIKLCIGQRAKLKCGNHASRYIMDSAHLMFKLQLIKKSRKQQS